MVDPSFRRVCLKKKQAPGFQHRSWNGQVLGALPSPRGDTTGQSLLPACQEIQLAEALQSVTDLGLVSLCVLPKCVFDRTLVC
jgi:hypothetical protein